MKIVYLTDKKPFPNPLNADKSGLLAIGGSLSKDRLIEAYSMGIFPWFSHGEPPMWWSPDPRFLLFPSNIHISKQMKRLLNKDVFRVTINKDFGSVIEKCSYLRRGEEGTWITEEMKKAYTELHKEGFAHSIEVWSQEGLIGGLYGISFGKMFFGESMFSEVSNSSKYGFTKLTQHLNSRDFLFIDCQVETQHLRSLGANTVKREHFIHMLSSGLLSNGLTKTSFPDSL